MSATAAKRNGKQSTRFTPSVSHPYAEREVTLHSLNAQRHFQRVFNRAQISAYQIVVMLPVFASKAESAECDSILSARLADTAAQMKELIAQCEERLQFNAITSQVRYTDAETRLTRLYTPHSGQFLGLLLTYDTLMQSVDTLWFNGVLARDQREEAIRRANTLVTDLMREMAALQKRVSQARERFRLKGREADAKQAGKLRLEADLAAADRASSVLPADEDAAHDGASLGDVVLPAPETEAADAGCVPECSAAEDAADPPAHGVDVFLDEGGAPRVVDAVDGAEFTGEHPENEAQLDSVVAELDAVPLDAQAPRRKAPARRRTAAAPAVATA